jgi:uncharacterized protein (DUF4415 family)
MPTKRMTKGASSRRGGPSRTSDAITGKTSSLEGTNKRRAKTDRVTTDWNKLRRLTDAQIRKGIERDPDAHPTDAAFWKDAKIVMPTPKTIVTMRLDADLLRWFRQQRGYQTRINAILRAYMNAQP